MENIVQIKNLRKEYGEFILEDISLNIPRGFITGIIGPNGAGKTTTIKLIMNMVRADGGFISVFGLDSVKNETDIKDRVGYVGEEQYFYDYHSAAWTGSFVSHFYSRWDKDKFAAFLEEFEIPPRKWIRKYSKGMKVKLALAIALSHHPELIILDEPTAGLDPVIRRDILDLLQKYAGEENRSVLISSHITEDLSRIADYITYMMNGRIVLFSAKDELMSDWKRVHFRQGALNEKITNSLEKVEQHMFGSSGITRHYSKIKDSLAGGVEAGTIKIENVGLDDILISMVKGK